ncbi:hypothetical protein [Alkalihalobacillus sp. 1P02AB]|uniref:hypothetical protein n=1 Tax=Alkalihalobacillus sp. 1P02AB TaxID=3132260 RepID=UPI0039A451F2
MNFLNRKIGLLAMAIILVMAVACNKEETTMNESSFNKNLQRVELYNQNTPKDYKLINWKERAMLFDELVFNAEADGKYLPLIWEDTTYQSFGLPAYVGDGRLHNDGAQEAVTNIAAIVSASLLGTDKSGDKNYVEQLSAFFSEQEQIVLNNPAGSSETTSMWYLLYPTILFAHVSDLYEDEDVLREQTLAAIESWYQAYVIMYDTGEPDFDYTGFNFLTMEPYRNGVWEEPDSAVGIGLLMYYGYEMTGDEKYLEAAINTMDYMETYFGSPLYEALMYFGPYLAAKLNAFHGTNYDIENFLNDNFNASSIPRGGWGSIVGHWGEYDINGLYGSASDGGGYAFSMNTFAAAGAIAPTVQYDPRFAKSIGKWMLHAASNSRYYFATETNPTNQSCTYFNNECNDIDPLIKKAIPYEGIRKDSQGRTPWFGGDPTVYDWAETDFSLYSGAHTGIFAALIEETNIEKILRLDLQATQFFNEHDFPTSLFFNPYEEKKEIEYEVQSEDAVDLYNSMKNSIVASNVTGATKVTIESDDALVLIELPAGSTIQNEDKNYYVDNKFISRDVATINIVNLNNNDSVSGKFTVELLIAANYEAEIDKVTVEIDGESFTFKADEKIELHTKDFSNGTKRLSVVAKTTDGSIDKKSLRLQFK